MPDPLNAPLQLTLAEPEPIPEGRWPELARLAERLCGADAAGVVRWSDTGPPALAALTRRLDREGGRTAIDDRDGSHLAGAGIGANVGGRHAALLWIAAERPFTPRALARLAWLAAGGADFLDALGDEDRRTELLLNEARHRCANDLHLVGSLLSHHARFAEDARVSAALEIVAGRVMILARARHQRPGDLVAGLRACAEALAAQVLDQGITVRLHTAGSCPPIDERRAAVLLLAANELVVNALKHGFTGDRRGHVDVTLDAGPDLVALSVEDDGSPLPAGRAASRPGSGMDLIARLVSGIRATLVPPPTGSKRFTIEMPVATATARGRNR